MLKSSENPVYPPGKVNIPAPDLLEQVESDPVLLEENHIVGFNGSDKRSRPFNLLRSQITKRLSTENWKVFGMTSATPAAGKSFLSLNLAAALSCLSDQTIYVFDFDLRRGSLAEALGIESGIGLGEYFEGHVENLADIGRRVDDTNMAIFPCFPTAAHSAELLAGERFDYLMEAIHALPDDVIVICDLPPAFANDDAIMITQKLDAYMLIVEQGVTTKKQIQDTVALLEPTPCLGTVLNRYAGGLNDPYGYGYGSGYDKYYSK